MDAASKTLCRKTLPTSDAATSSPESVVGPLLYVSPDGLSLFPCGLEVAPVSRSRRQENDKAKATSGTSGPRCSGSSGSAVLQRSLESRLRLALDGNGSPEYAMTWKHWAMPSGPPICALRASARRTSASASSGWPTPDAQAMNCGCDPEKHLARLERLKAKHNNGNGAGLTLGAAASLAGWPTPQASDHVEGARTAPDSNQSCLGRTLHGWASPSSRDHKDSPNMATTGTNPDGTERSRLDQLPRQAHGATTNSSTAGTGSRGVLAPEFPRWLMGYPAIWDSVSPHYAEYCQVQDAIAQGG